MGPNQTYMLCTAKETNKKKRQHREWEENNCKQCNQQNIQITHTTQQPKTKQPHRKMGKRHK